MDATQLYFFGKGSVASPLLGWYDSRVGGVLGALLTICWLVLALLLTTLDWPIQKLTGGQDILRKEPMSRDVNKNNTFHFNDKFQSRDGYAPTTCSYIQGQ